MSLIRPEGYKGQTCCRCKRVWAWPVEVFLGYQDGGATFTCPICNTPQSYTRTKAQRDLAELRARLAEVERERDALAALPKVRNRHTDPEKGSECPVCGQVYIRLQTHLTRMHPHYVPGGSE